VESQQRKSQTHPKLSLSALLCPIAIHGFPVRNEEELSWLSGTLIISPVQSVVSLPFKLDDTADWEGPQVDIPMSIDFVDGVGIDKVLKFIVFLQLVFGDEMVEGGEDARGERIFNVGNPRNFLLRLFEVTVKMELSFDTGDFAFGVLGDFADIRVAPIHQSNLM